MHHSHFFGAQASVSHLYFYQNPRAVKRVFCLQRGIWAAGGSEYWRAINMICHGKNTFNVHKKKLFADRNVKKTKKM